MKHLDTQADPRILGAFGLLMAALVIAACRDGVAPDDAQTPQSYAGSDGAEPLVVRVPGASNASPHPSTSGNGAAAHHLENVCRVTVFRART
jgi:hypothetical protein